MKSNFPFLKDYDQPIHYAVLELENNFNQKNYDFSKNTRLLLEKFIHKEFPEMYNVHTLGKKIRDSIVEKQEYLIANYGGTNYFILKSNFFDLNNKVKSLQHDTLTNYELNQNDKIEILRGLFLIGKVFSKHNDDTFDFTVYSNFQKNWFNNDLKNIFQEYLTDHNDLKDQQIFTAFILEEIISEFSDYIGSYEDAITYNNANIDAFYFNEEDETLNIVKSNYQYFNYSLTNFNDDIFRINELLKNMINDDNYQLFNDKITTLIKIKPKFINIFVATISHEKQIDKKEIKIQQRKIKNSLNGNIEINLQILDRDSMLDKYNFRNKQVNIEDFNIELELEHKDSFLELENTNSLILLASIKAKSLVNLYNETSGQILNKNLRGYIKNKKIDDAIVKTIIQEPENFMILNNGITAIAELNQDKNYYSGDILKFKNFHIINGGQTTRKLAEKSGTLSNINLFVKVIIPNNKEIEKKLIEEIAIASNQQKPIVAEDLWANDKRVLNFKSIFNKKNPDYYFMNKRDSDEKNQNKKNKTIISFKEFLQIIYSTLFLRADIARNSPQNIFSQRIMINTIFSKLTLEDRDQVSFLYDLIYIYFFILKYKKDIIKNKTESEWSKTNSQIVKNGSLFILMVFFSLYVGCQKTQKEIKELLAIHDNDDYLEELRKNTLNINFERILNRGENGSYQNDSYIPINLEEDLKNLIWEITIWIYNDYKEKVQDWPNFFKRKGTSVELSQKIFQLLTEDKLYLLRNNLYKAFKKITK